MEPKDSLDTYYALKNTYETKSPMILSLRKDNNV
jgi:hypothetical protein